MEAVKAHRDQTTRDFHNKIDHHRQRDSGLKGMFLKSKWAQDPTGTTHKWKEDLYSSALPTSVKMVAGAGLEGMELGTKIGDWVYGKTH